MVVFAALLGEAHVPLDALRRIGEMLDQPPRKRRRRSAIGLELAVASAERADRHAQRRRQSRHHSACPLLQPLAPRWCYWAELPDPLSNGVIPLLAEAAATNVMIDGTGARLRYPGDRHGARRRIKTLNAGSPNRSGRAIVSTVG